jgi:glycosyltransferase involved in cell wall biosynthesis
VPVIATEAGGLPEVLDHGKCGLLVPLRKQRGAEDVDIDRLSSAQLELLTNSEYARKLGSAGRKKVESKFGLPKMIDAVSLIYAEVCGQLGPGVRDEQSMPVYS